LKVLYLFSNKYPNDLRPRKAIEISEKYLLDNAPNAATYAKYNMKKDIIIYGLKLLEEQGVK
jgi:hypothetical protein